MNTVSKHGTELSYRKGCRCALCRSARSAVNIRYRQNAPSVIRLERDALKEAVAVAVQTLKFYADCGNWEDVNSEDSWPEGIYYEHGPVRKDCGSRARKALAALTKKYAP